MKLNIILTLSRPYAIERLVSELQALIKPEGTSLLVMADLTPQDFITARNAFNSIEGFDEMLVQHFRPPNKFGREIKEDEAVIRRVRISDIHNEAKQYLWHGDYVLVVEDDDIIPPDSLSKLLETLQSNPDAGAITGWQVSRHNFPFCGIWSIDNLERPSKISSVLPNETDEIDACGLYFMLVKQGLYGKHHFRPMSNFLGPDTEFGWQLRKAGHKILVNWDAPIPHINNKTGEAVPINKLWRATTTKGSYAWGWQYEEE